VGKYPLALASGREALRAAVETPTAAELLANPSALLTTSHLAELGLSRRGIEAVLRNCPAVILPGYRRPLIRVSDYLDLIERSLDRGDRVWPG
jgi:hypothetical protein